MIETIKQLCKNKGISIATLEQELGFSYRSVYHWDKNRPSIDKVKAVAEYLGVSIDYLVGNVKEYEEERKNEALEHAFNDRPEMRMLFDTTKDCTAEDIYQAIKIIEALKK